MPQSLDPSEITIGVTPNDVETSADQLNDDWGWGSPVDRDRGDSMDG
jgi:hypothetical protein